MYSVSRANTYVLCLTCQYSFVIILQVFDRFDADRDGALNKKELEAFAVASKTGENLSQDEIKQLGTFFDTNANGDLTHKGFEQMYLMQSNHQASDTWNDLERLGYTKELQLKEPIGEEDLTRMKMDEMRIALTELKEAPNSATAHRRVGKALEALGRADAAQKEFKQADELEAQAMGEGVDDQD